MNSNKKRMYFTVTIICILLVLPIRLMLGEAFSGLCTIFTVSQANKILFGNNEDYSNPDGRIGFYPPSSEGYGYIALGHYDKKISSVRFEGGLAEYEAIHTQGRILLVVAAVSIVAALALLMRLVYRLVKPRIGTN